MFGRSLKILCALPCIAVVLLQIVAIADLYGFEYGPLFDLLGPLAILLAVVINAALVVATVNLLVKEPIASPAFRKMSRFVLGLGVLALVWTADSVFVERPISARIAAVLTPDDKSDDRPADFRDFSIVRGATAENSANLWTAYRRIEINNPRAYARHPIGATIDKYAAAYQVDPTLLFYLNYIDSFYGEAVSGPLPFARAMTGESLRDVVQTHLPSWFIESDLRKYLIASRFFPDAVGEAAGFKLRYAVHKATLDVSSQPYALNTYSDIFLVLKEYPAEFADILQSNATDTLRAAVRESFLALQTSALQSPYEFPERIEPLTEDFYRQYRDDLKRFARASFYLVALDYEFATRVQALLTRYQTRYFSARMGEESWRKLPDWQQQALLAMVRDLYSPGVGRLGYNLYAIPEINCTPLEFVAAEAAKDLVSPERPIAGVWRPSHYEHLWAGAAYRLRVFNEIWSATHAAAMPGLPVESSIEDARPVVALRR